MSFSGKLLPINYKVKKYRRLQNKARRTKFSKFFYCQMHIKSPLKILNGLEYKDGNICFHRN